MRGKIEISLSFWVMLSCAMLAAPWQLLFALLLSAAAHETGHLALLALSGVEVQSIHLTLLGAEIRAEGVQRLSYGRELLVTLAGVTVNAVLAALLGAGGALLGANWLFVCAGANAVLAAYNLLPICPLDGGRALYLAVASLFGPMVGDAVAAVVGLLCATAALLLGAYISFVSRGGYFFLLAALSLFLGAVCQLGLAKNVIRV